MIVKIQIKDGWMFVDDVYNIEVRRGGKRMPDNGGMPVYKMASGEEYSVDMNIHSPFNKSSESETEYTIVSCFRKENDNITYAIDTNDVMAYLLNDEGKTIERI